MKFNTLTKAVAKNEMDTWSKNNWAVQNYSLSPDYEKVKNHFLTYFTSIELSTKSKYLFDLMIAMELYDYFGKIDSFSFRDSTKDEFWIYLSVQVIPEIVAKRWSVDDRARYYASSNRIWLKSLYWYVLLSWQGSSEKTLEILKDCTTDTIMQLTDRVSRKGYNVELYRIIMRQYYEHRQNGSFDTLKFRKVLILNTAYVKTTNPFLFDGGLESYVSWLFKQVN